jgi:chemotaxis protein MotA
MNDTAPTAENIRVPTIKVQRPSRRPDFATILGLTFAIGMIVVAIMMGQSDANFFNVPSVLIVFFGTMAATAISYTGEELGKAGKILGQTILGNNQDPSKLAMSLLDSAVVAKKKGILALSQNEKEFAKDKFLKKSVQMVVDGYNAKDIEFFLAQEIDSEIERHKRSASITRRASEVAPAMGLIGTLVGLVQMLADLENPETIGPAMAVALLTTFYGAILGTVVMAPLSVKLQKRSSDNELIKTLIKTACISIARQENPRKLEMLLNADLPPAKRIRYFD